MYAMFIDLFTRYATYNVNMNRVISDVIDSMTCR